MTGNERLARAVLLFFRGGPWTDNDRAVWVSMTGRPTPTAATLCDFAREVLSDEGCGAKASALATTTGGASMSDLYEHRHRRLGRSSRPTCYAVARPASW